MDDEGLMILREALETQLRNEEFDRAVGRAIRRSNLDFKKYVEVMGELRELAHEGSVSVEEVAKRLVTTGREG